MGIQGYIVVLCLAIAMIGTKSRAQSPPVTLANTEVKQLTSSANGETYHIYVKFPAGYPDNRSDYPVLYITDAETNFGGISYIVQRLIKDRLIPPILLIGIAYNTEYDTFYQLRSRDLTPTYSPEFTVAGRPMPNGKADPFLTFIETELFPFIERTYKTSNTDRSIYGHSFGGLFGVHVLLTRPDLFNRYLLLSPSLWWDDRVLFERLDERAKIKKATRLYMASGELEQRIATGHLDFISAWKSEAQEPFALKSEILDNETHRTIFGNGFTRGLRFLYQR